MQPTMQEWGLIGRREMQFPQMSRYGRRFVPMTYKVLSFKGEVRTYGSPMPRPYREIRIVAFYEVLYCG